MVPANHWVPSGVTVYLLGTIRLYQTTLPVETKSLTLKLPSYWVGSTVDGSAASSNWKTFPFVPICMFLET